MRRVVLTLTTAALAACSDGTATSPTATDLTGGSNTDQGTTRPTTGLPTTSDPGPDATAAVSEGTGRTSTTGVTGTTGSTADETTAAGTCTLAPAPAGPIAIDPACEASSVKQVLDPWNFKVEWSYAAQDDVHALPVVGPLIDDDGDGDVDGDDQPVVVIGVQDGTLVALRGDGGGPVFALAGMHATAGPAIADVDSDGAPEIVMITAQKSVVAVGGDGVIEWTSPPLVGQANSPQVTVADLDGDGDVEVIADNTILDGKSGALIAAMTVKGPYRTPVVADLDLDGSKEIVLHHQVFASTGALLWEIIGGNGLAAFASVANIDDDPEAELFISYGTTLYVREHDGTPIGKYPIPGEDSLTLFGPTCMADFDGDGQVDIVIPAADVINMMDPDGTVLWQAAIQDPSGAAGCSGYDIDGDGTYEVLFADEHHLYVFDGPTGAVLYDNPDHDSDTYLEYPVVADVDRDGSAEILVVTSGEQHGLNVFGHAGDGWSASGPAWPVHDYAVTNVGQDGSVPPSPEPSWAAHNIFRARPTVDHPALPDLLVSITDTCHACATGEVQIAYQVCNQGDVDVDAGVPLTLFTLAGGTETVVETRAMPAVATGTCLAGDTFVFPATQLVDGGVIVRLHDDGGGTGPTVECSVDNDQAAAEPTGC
jgi:hypothetical protein